MQFPLSKTTARALAAPIEATLKSLLEEYEFDDNRMLLESLSRLDACLRHHGLVCVPPIGVGGLGDARVISNSDLGSLSSALNEIAALETSVVEFKSSLAFDWRRFNHDPGKTPETYKSEAVEHSALKTIAAFANTEGGTIYLGVEDNGRICGLAKDFQAVNSEKSDYDGWDLYLRNLLRGKFSDGAALNHYVKSVHFKFEDRSFVQLKVAPKQKLTFLKKEKSWELYIRAGTETTAIQFDKIEHYFEVKKLF